MALAVRLLDRGAIPLSVRPLGFDVLARSALRGRGAKCEVRIEAVGCDERRQLLFRECHLAFGEVGQIRHRERSALTVLAGDFTFRAAMTQSVKVQAPVESVLASDDVSTPYCRRPARWSASMPSEPE